MKNKTCLFAVTNLFQRNGGIDAVNRLVVHALAEKGFKVDILALSDTSTTLLDERYIDTAQASYQSFGNCKLSFTSRLYGLLTANRYDLLLVDHVNLASILSPWRLFGKRFCVWLFGVEVFAPNPSWEGRLGIMTAQICLAISEHTKGRVQSRFPQLHIYTCPLAIDPFQHTKSLPDEPVESAIEPISLTAVSGRSSILGSQVVLNVGRMVHSPQRHKGQQVLIQAMPQVLTLHPNAQLVLAGSGPQLEIWRELARKLPPPTPDHIFMPGFVSEAELSVLYQACSLFAMPSIGEGFGLVYLEAMRYAKPCLGANVDATLELLHHEVNGLLVEDADSISEVVRSVNYILSHPAEAQAMGRRGYDRLRQKYLYPQFAERLWDCIENYLQPN